jgi:uncharacterized membrane protein
MQQGITMRPMRLSELLDASFALYRREFVPLVFVALSTQALPLILTLFVELGGGVGERPLLWLASVVASLILGQVGIAASTFIVAEAYLGGTITPQEAFRRAAPFIGRLLLAAIASGLLFGLGFILLIVPGVIIMCALAVTGPAIVLENQPTATAGMSRSWNLTKGFRGKVFGAYMVAFFIILLPGVALGAISVAATASAESASAPAVAVLLVQMILQVLAYPYIYVLTTLLYYDFRVRKEAYDLEMLSTSLGAA